MPKPAATTPRPARSPARRAPDGSYSPASPATNASATPSTCKPSPHYAVHPEPAPTTTPTAPAATPTTKPYAPWPTASSASCTAACATGRPTTKPPPGHRSHNSNLPPRA
jgi:hypothetical protein